MIPPPLKSPDNPLRPFATAGPAKPDHDVRAPVGTTCEDGSATVNEPLGGILWRSSVGAARSTSLLLYLAIGALAVAVIFGLSTDVRAAARRLFSPRPQ